MFGRIPLEAEEHGKHERGILQASGASRLLRKQFEHSKVVRNLSSTFWNTSTHGRTFQEALSGLVLWNAFVPSETHCQELFEKLLLIYRMSRRGEKRKENSPLEKCSEFRRWIFRVRTKGRIQAKSASAVSHQFVVRIWIARGFSPRGYFHRRHSTISRSEPVSFGFNYFSVFRPYKW